MLFTQLRRYCQVRSEHSDSPAGPAQRAERAEHAEQNGVLHIPMTRDCWKDKVLSRKRLGQDKKQAPNKSKHFVQKANTCLLKASTCLLTTKSEHLTNKSEHLTNKSEHFSCRAPFIVSSWYLGSHRLYSTNLTSNRRQNTSFFRVRVVFRAKYHR